MEKAQRHAAFQQNTKPKRRVGRAILVLALLVLAVAAFFAWRILSRPASLFAPTDILALPEQTALAPAMPISDEWMQEEEPADSPSRPQVQGNILNILLMGIDAREDGSTTSGTMPHTDVMMVVAVNFDTNSVDLITLPRDLLTTVPGHYGFYKLNGVFNVGLGGQFKTTGQADDLKDGFELTCRAGEMWLGGVSIPYYYALDFQAVMDVVDAIGGIDYDVDQAFTSMSGKYSYKKGMQHLDGDAVMGYLRIRQAADGLDSSRTARQRRMMVAIFNKLKTEGKLSQIPALISAANSGIYTNTTLIQTTALVNYAANLSPESIHTHSLYGEIGKIEFYWRFAYVDQQNRLDVIRQVYGFDADTMGTCSRQYERWLFSVGFLTLKRLRQMEQVLTRVQELKDAGTAFSEEQIALYASCYNSYLALYRAFEDSSDALAHLYAANPWREKKNGSRTSAQKAENKKISAQEAEIKSNLLSLSESAHEATQALASSIRYENLTWSLSGRWYTDPDIEEVIVAFG